MTPKEYAELLEYIFKFNSWNNMYTVAEEMHRRCIKYVDAAYDTRDNTIFSVTFRSIMNGDKREASFRVDTEDGVKKLYEWLDEEVKK